MGNRSERQFEVAQQAGRQAHAGGQTAHLVLHGALDLVNGIVKRGGDQVFEHILVIANQAVVNADPPLSLIHI